jgi:sterol 3beta-glucosyltransferase
MVVTSIGSTGDVQPLLGLANELSSHGHEITFALPSLYRERVQELGFRFVEIGQGTGVDAWHEIFARQAEIADPVEQTRYFVETLVPWMPQMYRELRDLCSGADVLISPAFQLAARMAHDATGIPFASVHLSPFGSKGGKAIREISAPLVNQVRQDAGLPPLEDPLGADGASPQLALYAVSQHVFRPPAGWPVQSHLTGYWFFDDENWQPPPELVEFLQAGAPPVAVSFGSMPSADPEALTDLILKAVAQTGCRAIIQRGGGGLARQRSLPENVHAVDFVPHGWLFPRASCVVHHGGAGTTAAAFRAGVPTVVVPHLLDQPIWAEYARAFGCAGAVIPHAQLTAEKLSAALTQTLSNARFGRAAARLGEQIRAENGVQVARQLITNVVR